MVGQLVRAGEPKVIGDNENRMAKLRSRDNWKMPRRMEKIKVT